MMRKVNLLYVITKLELGGAQKHLLSLIGLLDKERFNVFLFTAGKGLLLREASAIKGLTIVRSTSLECSINPAKDLLALIEICRFIKKKNIDIVHTHSSKAGILGRWAARFAGAKVILHTVHGWSFNDFQPQLLRFLFLALESITARFTHKLIVVSDYDRQKGLRHHIGNNCKYALIRYGIDYPQFSISGQNIGEALGIRSGELVVGTVSCFKPQKSPQDFVKLASMVKQRIPHVKFIMVGDGKLRPAIEKLISKLNLSSSLILLGWRSDIPQIMQLLDVFVLTSLWEGLPISVLEAMVSSKPVLATDTGGISEIIEEGKTGFLVSPFDMYKMSEKLVSLLKDEALRKRISCNARDSLGSNFTISNMLQNTLDLYDSLLS